MRLSSSGIGTRLLSRKEGTVAVLFALLAVPMVLAVGAAVDFGRVYVAAKNLQSVVDAAALAGGTAFSDESREELALAAARAYFERGAATLPEYLRLGAVSFTTTPAEGCTERTAAERITVTASATIETTLMSFAVPVMNTTASATSAHPLVEFYIDVTDFNFAAHDRIGIWWYKLPTDGVDPQAADLSLIVDNTTTGPVEAVRVCVGPDQKIGFAFSDRPAYPNLYGGIPGNQYYYYSTLVPPSANAYPAWAFNSTLQIVDVSSGGAYPPQATSTISPPGTPGFGYFDVAANPFSAIAASGAVSCNELNGRAIHLYWNDMGGYHYDDYDYNDAEINFSCATVKNGSVYLEQ